MCIGDKFVLGLDAMSTVNVVSGIKLLKGVEPCSKRIARVNNGDAPMFATACGEFLDFGKAYYVKEPPSINLEIYSRHVLWIQTW